MTKNKKLLLLLLLAAFGMASCTSEQKIVREETIKFSFSESGKSTKGGRIASQQDMAAVMVTIVDGSGNTVADQKELTLYKFGDAYLSAPLTLKTTSGDNYSLTEFFVLDADHNIIYVTPKEGSPMAHLVTDPLAIDFAIIKNQISTVTPEVVAVDANTDPEDFGYGQFGFNIVKSINVIFSSFIQGISNFELTDAHLKIIGRREASSTDTTALWTYETDLQAKANTVTLREAPAYQLIATKPGYKTWKRLQSLANQDKIEILLEKDDVLKDKPLPLVISFTDKTVVSGDYKITFSTTYDQQLRAIAVNEELKSNASNYLYMSNLTYSLPNLIPATQHIYNQNATSAYEHWKITQASGQVVSMNYTSTYSSAKYTIFTTTSSDGLITQAIVRRTDLSYPDQVHHFYYDGKKNLTKSEVYLDGSGYEDGTNKIYEQTFTYDENENAIPLPLLNGWVRDVTFTYGHITGYDFWIVPFLVQKPNNSIISTTYSLFDLNVPGQVTGSEKVNFNYTYQSGKPSALTVHHEGLNKDIRTDFTFSY